MFSSFRTLPSSRGRTVVAAIVFALAASGLAVAQTQSGTPRSATERRVADAVRAKFKALPVQDGIVLVPLGRYQGVDNIELRNGTIAVNGRVVTGGELRERLGRDADPILELSYFDLETQQRLLLGTRAATEPKPEAPSPEPPSAEPPQAPAPPEESERAPRREFRQESDGQVRIGRSITVSEDEQVNGPVVAVAGDVRVSGRVREDVVAIGGNVHLGQTAEVDGDVTVVGGMLSRDSGARVRGKVNEVGVSFPPIHVRPLGRWSVHAVPWFGDGAWRTFRLFGTLLRMAMVGLFATILVLLVPRAVERVGETVRLEPWKAGLVGLLAQLLFIPLLLLTVIVLAVSIIGIPLLVLVPFAILAFFVALLLGFTGAATALSSVGERQFGWSVTGAFIRLVVGLLLIWGLTVVGRMVALGGGPFAFAGAIILLGGLLVEYAAWTVGLGGALLTRFGRRGPLATTVPPIPATPPPSQDPHAIDLPPGL